MQVWTQPQSSRIQLSSGRTWGAAATSTPVHMPVAHKYQDPQGHGQKCLHLPQYVTDLLKSKSPETRPR